MKFLKVRGSTVSHKQCRSSAKHMHCRGTLKLIQEWEVEFHSEFTKSDKKSRGRLKLCAFLAKKRWGQIIRRWHSFVCEKWPHLELGIHLKTRGSWKYLGVESGSFTVIRQKVSQVEQQGAKRWLSHEYKMHHLWLNCPRGVSKTRQSY